MFADRQAQPGLSPDRPYFAPFLVAQISLFPPAGMGTLLPPASSSSGRASLGWAKIPPLPGWPKFPWIFPGGKVCCFRRPREQLAEEEGRAAAAGAMGLAETWKENAAGRGAPAS